MALTKGQRIGVYEVIDSLGAGGMGVVYRARDTRLNREVALKVLPEAFASEPERMARFEREAQVLASLNHPHIATVYGFEDASSEPLARVRALAMELVPGETLAARLARGPMTVAEAIALAKQIAAALEAAHEQGVIHRDLKPANIHVTPAGSIKVLDFGLAKLVAPVGADASGSSQRSQSLSPTITSPAMATSVGMLLGTAAYMSPEQAKGREAGPRSDVWAFGCVLYEMLTGHGPFRADDVTETLAAILMRDPDWTRLPADTPINVERLLKRCLRRDAAQRLHAIADARLELEDAPLHPPAPLAPTARPGGRFAAVTPWSIAAVALLVAAFLGARLMRSAPVSSPVVAFSIAPPADTTVGSDTPVAISPDGRTLVLSFDRGGVPQLFRRRIDQLDAVPIPGTERAGSPFFSPDGRWLAFTQTGKLRKVAIDGGAAVDIAEVTSFQGGVWNSDDTIVYNPHFAVGLWQVPAAGGTATKLTEPAEKDQELGHWHPQALPDGRTILFTNYRVSANDSRIETYSLDTKQRRVIIEHAIFGRYLPTGHLLFVRGTTVFAVPFEVARLATAGNPTPILDGVATASAAGRAYFAVSSSGTLAYIADDDLNAPTRLTWVKSDGTAAPVGVAPRRFSQPSLSPDGRTIAAVVNDGETDIWVADVERGVVRRVTDAPGTQTSPVWTPDSRWLFFASEEPAYHIYRQAPGATAPPERLVDGSYDAVPSSVLPSGEGILYTLSDPTTRTDIWLLPLTGDRKPRALVKTRFEEGDAQVSPDGRWLAYTSNESGRAEVYVQMFPEGGGRTQVSIEGGNQPRWSADGRELFFRSSDQMMRVSVGAAAPLAVSRPTQLFRLPFESGYSVARDGRFLIAQRDPQAPPVRVNVILNWFDQLRARVAVP